MSDFVGTLREQLVDAAERERTRRLPRLAAPSPMLVVAGVAAAAMVLIVVLAAAALNPRPAEDEARPAETPAPEGRDLFGGTLVPDVRYRTTEFVPRLSFAVDDDRWFAQDTTLPSELRLIRVNRGAPGPDPPRIQQLVFLRIPQVADPSARGIDGSRMPAPADLHGWLSEHPDLRVGPPRSVTVAGVPGERFDLRARFDRPAHVDPWCRQHEVVPCTFIAPGVNLPDGMRMRMTILRTEPEPLVIIQGGMSQADMAAVEEAGAPLLDSLRIGVP